MFVEEICAKYNYVVKLAFQNMRKGKPIQIFMQNISLIDMRTNYMRHNLAILLDLDKL